MIKTTHLPATLRGLFCSLGVIATASLLSGCQDENYGFETQEIRNSVYLRNFEKTYGKIAEDQIWDFSSYNLNKLGLEGGPTGDLGSATTRAQEGVYSVLTQDWYTVSSETSTWLSNNLKEKINNSGSVSSFQWIKEDNDTRVFYIIPIYQGQTGMVWDLELLDNKSGNNYQSRTTIWSKSQNLKYTENYSKWEEYVYETGPDSPNEMTLNFASPFSKFTNNTTEVAAAFAVSTDIKGSFYITINEEEVKLTWGNAEEWLKKNGCNSGGTFTFTNAKNVSLNSNQEITPSSNLFNVNYVPFTELLNTTINEHKITRDDLKTLSFKIDDDQNPAQNQAFYTWGDYRIQVFLHFNGVSSNEVNLSSIPISGQNSFVKCHTINRFNIKTHPIKIDMSKIQGTEFAFNLKTTGRTSGDKDLCEIGDDHRSDLGFMSQIDHFNGTVLDRGKFQKTMKDDFGITLANDFEIKVIGCEDAGANGKQADNDYNDVVFLLVADKFPNQVIKKRYMIEDLGSTHDFDFNDIVVDVTETVSRLTNGNKKYKQEAAIRHLCGTIPFRVKLGNKYFGYGDKEGAMMRGHNSGGHTYDPSATYNTAYTWTVEREISSDTELASFRAEYWNPDANNITVEVWPTYASEDNDLSHIYWTDGENNKADNVGAKDYNVQARQIVEFPKVGKYPYIIATNQNVGWMEETISIPLNWMKTKPSGYSNGFTPGQSTNDDGTSAPTNNHYETPGNKTIWTGTATTDNYSAHVAFNATDERIQNLHVGDVIVVSTQNVQNGAQGAVRLNKITDGSWDNINNSLRWFDINGDYTVTITQDILNAIQSNGLVITGTKHTITGVSVRCSHSDTPAAQYNVSVSASNNNLGQVSVSSNVVNGKADENSSITINANATQNGVFTKWSDGDTNAQRTITVTGDINLKAYFDVMVAKWVGNNAAYNLTNQDGKNMVYLKDFIPSWYNGIDNILVTVTNPSNQAITAYVRGGNQQTSTETIPAGSSKTFVVSNSTIRASEYIRLEITSGSDVFSTNAETRAKIYVTTNQPERGQEAEFTSEQVFGNTNWWKSGNNNNYAILFNGDYKLSTNLLNNYSTLRVYYTNYYGIVYNICQSNGGNWYDNPLVTVNNSSTDPGLYVDLPLTNDIINSINNNSRPLYFNTSSSDGNIMITKVTLIAK